MATRKPAAKATAKSSTKASTAKPAASHTTRAEVAAAETNVTVGAATDAELQDRADAANDELVDANVNDERGYIGRDASDLIAEGNVVTTVRPGAPTL